MIRLFGYGVLWGFLFDVLRKSWAIGTDSLSLCLIAALIWVVVLIVKQWRVLRPPVPPKKPRPDPGFPPQSRRPHR